MSYFDHTQNLEYHMSNKKPIQGKRDYGEIHQGAYGFENKFDSNLLNIPVSIIKNLFS